MVIGNSVHVLSCKNKCRDYVKHIKGWQSNKYGGNRKRCTYCDIFIVYEGLYCPCCGAKLRNRRGKWRKDVPRVK